MSKRDNVQQEKKNENVAIIFIFVAIIGLIYSVAFAISSIVPDQYPHRTTSEELIYVYRICSIGLLLLFRKRLKSFKLFADINRDMLLLTVVLAIAHCIVYLVAELTGEPSDIKNMIVYCGYIPVVLIMIAAIAFGLRKMPMVDNQTNEESTPEIKKDNNINKSENIDTTNIKVLKRVCITLVALSLLYIPVNAVAYRLSNGLDSSKAERAFDYYLVSRLDSIRIHNMPFDIVGNVNIDASSKVKFDIALKIDGKVYKAYDVYLDQTYYRSPQCGNDTTRIKGKDKYTVSKDKKYCIDWERTQETGELVIPDLIDTSPGAVRNYHRGMI